MKKTPTKIDEVDKKAVKKPVEAKESRNDSKKELYFLCWNLNGIRAWSKKGCMDWVLQENPDFFCVQETKAHPDQLTSDLISPPGYTSYFDHSKLKKGYSGVAIYAKTKPERVDYELKVKLPKSVIETLNSMEGAEVIDSDTRIDHEGRFVALYYPNFVLINCYFPNGGGAPERLEYKLSFYESFFNYINKLKKQGKKVIFCGDVNVAHTEMDIARPKENQGNVGFLPIERAWIDKVIASGYIDTFRTLYPTLANAYSWWDMKSAARDRNIGWRIDYFFTDESLRTKIKDAKIHADVYGSDHCPISLKVAI